MIILKIYFIHMEIFSLCKRNIREFINRDFYTKEEYKEMIQLFDVLDETYTFLSKNK